ncbi:MAG TPA: hypothetical protein ENN92_01220 [candidate division WWE3 bacterium]|uniref:Uncharacterized protein n=1 Tax=candidate division WWE3 bacterium TaxID=2053526 RepID=A0A7C1DJ55_UNCKA|nr:hypothetical protein [candidate division WWE3 bacterium]
MYRGVYKRRKSKDEKGIGLVEVMLAFGVSVIVITALVSLSTFVLKSATTSSRMMQGTRLVNKEIEAVRVVRDLHISDENLSWEDFYNVVGACILGSGTATDPVCSASACTVDLESEGTSYLLPVFNEADSITVCFGSREVVSEPDKIDIIAVATWNIGGQTKYVHNYTRLTDW